MPYLLDGSLAVLGEAGGVIGATGGGDCGYQAALTARDDEEAEPAFRPQDIRQVALAAWHLLVVMEQGLAFRKLWIGCHLRGATALARCPLDVPVGWLRFHGLQLSTEERRR